MANNPNKPENEPYEDGQHEGGRGGNAQGHGYRQTQKQAQAGKMPLNGLDYEKQQEKALKQGSGGNKKSKSQSRQNDDSQ